MLYLTRLKYYLIVLSVGLYQEMFLNITSVYFLDILEGIRIHMNHIYSISIFTGSRLYYCVLLLHNFFIVDIHEVQFMGA